MKDNKTVVISCAGMGKRLGIGTTKALVNVGGKPLIIRTLELLKDVQDVRIVVGYQSEKVIQTVNEYRKNITYVFNHNYMNNGTAASVSLALPGAKEYVLTIDGDIIINPEDMQKILDADYEFVCGCEINSDDPVMLSVDNHDNVVSFSREKGDYEWTGICNIKSCNLQPSDHHVYQMIEPLMPKKFMLVRLKEIDTMDDYYRAEQWVNNNFTDRMVIGVVGGMGSWATLNFFERILNAFPAQKEWERPRVIIDNNCTMPSRVRALLYDEKRSQLEHELSRSVQSLIDAGATDIVLACNTSHAFLPVIHQLVPKAKQKVLNIIQLLADYCGRNTITNCYLLASEGTIQTKIYDEYFCDKKVTLHHNEKDFNRVRKYIEAVKTNNINSEIVNDFAKFINGIKYDYVILGCTELPVLYDRTKNLIHKQILDPLTIVLNQLKNKTK